jgi:4-amino-4-deoxy-L-arabinose transferase-like glycosyltransferase
VKNTLTLRRPFNHPLFWHAIPLLFILCMVLFFPFRYRFEFDHDEGINAIKAMLNIQGHQLYSDVWSDQPPVFNILLTLWFRLFGLNINAGRGFVLLFSASILWMTIQYLRRFFGDLHAIFGILAMTLLPLYLRLSVSIMIGLPSITLALLSFFALVLWHKFGDSRWLLLSASALGFSIMTKLFTAILVPIFFSGILLSGLIKFRQSREWLKACIPSMLWLTIFSVVAGSLLLFVVRPENISQLTQVHLTAGDSELFRTYAENKTLIYFSNIKDSLHVLMLAFLGGIFAYRSRSWTAIYLVAWVALGSILLFFNVPFWYHHLPLITVPAAILAAIAVGDGLYAFQNFLRSRETTDASISLSFLSLILVIAYLATRLPPTFKNLDLKLPNLRGHTTEDLAEYGIVASMWNYAKQTNWVYTDRPMFAFRANLPVPPYLAVMSKKRIAAGVLTDDQIFEILVEYKPEQVFQERIDLPAVQEYMSIRNFRRIDSTNKFRLFVRNDILQLYESPASIPN